MAITIHCECGFITDVEITSSPDRCPKCGGKLLDSAGELFPPESGGAYFTDGFSASELEEALNIDLATLDVNDVKNACSAANNHYPNVTRVWVENGQLDWCCM